MKFRHIEIVMDWSTAEITFKTCHFFFQVILTVEIANTKCPVWLIVLRTEILL